MSTQRRDVTATKPPSDLTGNVPSTRGGSEQLLFWGCFIALVTTAFGFIARIFLVNTWEAEFGLDKAQSGRLLGIGIWPFAVSIIGFSLVIDKIGYKASMIIAFLGHIAWAAIAIGAYFVSDGGDKATAYSMLYWGSLLLALANGTVEAFINPVVATMFSREKTKWLNILHAGWPGGLVIAGMVTIFMGDVPWWGRVGVIAVPAVVYFVMLIGLHFPEQERVTAGVSYKEMLSQFGTLGAAVVGFLLTLQLMDFFSPPPPGKLDPTLRWVFIGIGVAIVLAFGAYTQSLGHPLLFLLVLIMMPLATTEIGTDGWITGIMEGITKDKFHPGWILVFTSVIMMVLRFFAGPIIHALTPLGLLAISSALAIAGLAALSASQALAAIFGAAFIYGLGKTFFWPTMLGVVAEQTPKGGALTLNAISGIGMLAVGTLGTTYIGSLQANKEIAAVVASAEAQSVPGLVENGALKPVEDRSIYEIIEYKAISNDQLKAAVDRLPEDKRAEVTAKIKEVRDRSSQGALMNMAWFPAIMLLGYLGLIAYFQARGGYKPIHLDAAH